VIDDTITLIDLIKSKDVSALDDITYTGSAVGIYKIKAPRF
jgi:hypothetical protein